ncbi:hypothetical protein DFA_08136 [Cavenderia fasciculata]|uniref:SET domain-containing protein n=1 Tax=Cavenderia fasciculata TaxID=261658 RepID=F4Q595_CACFS|nr:uncharacterized protein DFA_08136 [Cavenderia fasciculata]EGG17154.1 hypothetical protein DFA_08136 [Cavenderia fasciculata]|eukprot:XP_004355638.1 hypothetical protein DFA_08136 [Cavenderia fasciculata]
MFELALECYDKGLEIDAQHETLLLNKLSALLSLYRYHEAFALGEPLLASGTLEDNNIARLLTRLAKGYYAVGMYEKALECNNRLLETQPKSEHKELKLNVRDCLARLEERDNGIFKFKELKEHLKATEETDISEYIGPVRIKKTRTKTAPFINTDRIGLECTRDVQGGTILFVNKAVKYVKGLSSQKLIFDQQDSLNMLRECTKAMPSLNQHQHRQCRAILAFAPQIMQFEEGTNNLVERVQADPNLQLEDFKFINNQETEKMDINYNQNDRKFLNVEISQLALFGGNFISIVGAWGLWPMLTLVNHACIQNAGYFNIGDYIFVVAAQSLKAGEEIFISRKSVSNLSYSERKDHIGLCECKLCRLDSQESAANCHLRKLICEDYFQNIRPKLYHDNATPGIFGPKLELMMKQLKNTYNDPERPYQLELQHPFTGLAVSYQETSYEKALVAYLKLIEMNGFTAKLCMKKDRVSKDRIHHTIECEGPLVFAHAGMFMTLLMIAGALDYQILVRQCLALSRMAAFINQGYTNKEHAQFFKSFGHTSFSFDSNDTIELIDMKKTK